MSFLPIIVIGGAFVLLSGKKKRRRTAPKELPESKSTDRGEVFDGHDAPDVIIDKVGSRFSVKFSEYGGTGHSWTLSASPPDDSIEFVGEEYDSLPESEVHGVGGHIGDSYYVFEGKKPGEGSIVFHLNPPGPPPQPPAEVVEIKTKIS